MSTVTGLRAYGTPSFDWFWYGLAIILPFVAPLIAIWWLAHDRVGPGLAVLLTGWVSASLWFAALLAFGLST